MEKSILICYLFIEFLIENLPIQAEAEPMQIEKPEIMSPLTNEEDSREETPKDNKNDEDIDELLKNIDTKLPDKNVTIFFLFYRK